MHPIILPEVVVPFGMVPAIPPVAAEFAAFAIFPETMVFSILPLSVPHTPPTFPFPLMSTTRLRFLIVPSAQTIPAFLSVH